jgi:large subunit ribosomal protein L23
MATMYEILLRPLVTEKSSYQSGKLSQYAFVVAPKATRTMVKDAIENLYDVDVVRVNIMHAPAKRSRTRGGRSRRMLIRKPAYKKALITLAEGQTLPIFEGVQ